MYGENLADETENHCGDWFGIPRDPQTRSVGVKTAHGKYFFGTQSGKLQMSRRLIISCIHQRTSHLCRTSALVSDPIQDAQTCRQERLHPQVLLEKLRSWIPARAALSRNDGEWISSR